MAATITSAQRAAFRGGAIGGGVVSARAEVWHRTKGRTATLSITGARVTYDAGAAFPRSCTVTLAGFEAILPDASALGYRGTFADTDGTMGDGIFGDPLHRELRGLLIPGVNQLRVYVTVADGDVLMGHYDIARPSFAHGDRGITAEVTGYDVARRVRKATYALPYNIARGTNIATALANHLANRAPGVTLTTPGTAFTTPALTFLPLDGQDPLADAQELALSAGWVLSTTRDGGFIAAPPQDPGSGTPVWSIDEATLVGLETAQDDEDVRNALTIVGATEDGTAVYGVARHTTGPYGTTELGERAHVEESEYVQTAAQAETMARTKLPRLLGFVDRVTLRIPLAAHLDHGDLIEITDNEMQLEDAVYLAEQVEHDLTNRTTTITVSRRLV